MRDTQPEKPHTAIALAGVTHQYPGQEQLFKPLDLVLEAGKTHAVTGPSGSGKSTLLAILARQLAPSAGTIQWPPDAKLSFVFQNPVGVPRRSAIDQVCLPMLITGNTRREAYYLALRTMRTLGIADIARRPFRELSGGQAQRVMLARAICLSPQVLLVDEPTAQLDRSNGTTVIEALHKFSLKQGVTVVATHDLALAAACDTHIELRPSGKGNARK